MIAIYLFFVIYWVIMRQIKYFDRYGINPIVSNSAYY